MKDSNTITNCVSTDTSATFIADGSVSHTTSLECDLTGSQNVMSLLDPKLVISNAQISDAGDYKCCVTNTDSKQCGNDILVGYKPNVAVITDPIEALYLTQHTIKCTVKAFPDITAVEWNITTETGTKIFSSDVNNLEKYFGFSETFLSLDILDFTDTGQYICTAENIFGKTSSTVVIQVYGISLTVSSTNYKIVYGDDVELECNITGRPDITKVTWSMQKETEEHQIDMTNILKYNGSTLSEPSLMIYNVTFEDDGIYFCEAGNSYENKTSLEVKLTVTSDPTLSPTTPQNAETTFPSMTSTTTQNPGTTSPSTTSTTTQNPGITSHSTTSTTTQNPGTTSPSTTSTTTQNPGTTSPSTTSTTTQNPGTTSPSTRSTITQNPGTTSPSTTSTTTQNPGTTSPSTTSTTTQNPGITSHSMTSTTTQNPGTTSPSTTSTTTPNPGTTSPSTTSTTTQNPGTTFPSTTSTTTQNPGTTSPSTTSTTTQYPGTTSPSTTSTTTQNPGTTSPSTTSTTTQNPGTTSPPTTSTTTQNPGTPSTTSTTTQYPGTTSPSTTSTTTQNPGTTSPSTTSTATQNPGITPAPTTLTTPTTTTKPEAIACQCPCSSLGIGARQDLSNYTIDELLEKLAPQLAKMEKELSIDKSNLSATINKRISAKDERKSSQSIGILGIVFIVSVILGVVIIDLMSAVKLIKPELKKGKTDTSKPEERSE
ncbi:mucin-3A-like [Mytilus californianus]|uniref:mucin-3A-like n=1 Tax=Mytilus californianus TaxID=6549 RepID=UPI002246567F|nr:mucin-3A-like [Mytilus californianus]